MMGLYCRPAGPVRLGVEPCLASWEVAGHPSQVQLTAYLDALAAIAAPMAAAVKGRLAVELIVGLPDTASLTSGGRDLDNYLYPLAQRLGPNRLAAVFGRKTHGSESWLAVGPAVAEVTAPAPMVTVRITGSYVRAEWKQTLQDRLRDAQVPSAGEGAVDMDIAVTTGPGRNWANLWKPLLDSFGPVLGEDSARAFHPYDDQIISLGLHHSIAADVGHDVIIEARWHGVPAQ